MRERPRIFRPGWRVAGVAVSALALALAALPSAAGPGASAAGGSPLAKKGGLSFASPVRLENDLQHETADGAGEPVVAFDSKGTVYVQGTCCVVLPAETWYSKDGGRTFAHMPSPARENQFGAEGAWAVDDADRPIFADTAIPYMVVTRWRDHGDTPERTVIASEVTAPLQDRPWLGWGQGSLYMYTNSGLQTTYVYQSYDEGLTFNPSPVGTFSGNFPTTMTANRQDGAVWLFSGAALQADVIEANGTINHTDAVATEARGSTPGPFDISVATDEAGNGYVVWTTANTTGCDVYMTSSSDHGKTWRPAVKVNSATGCATFPWVDAGDAGHVAVTWYQTDALTSQDAVPSTSEWHVRAAVSVNALTAKPTFAEAELPNVTVLKGPLGRNLWDFMGIAVGPNGKFGIVYVVGEPAAGTDCSGQYTGVCKHVWYVTQGGGPLLHADRLAAATAVTISQAKIAGGKLNVSGGAVFKAAPRTELFPQAVPNPGGGVLPVGPDSDELLFDITTASNGAPGADGLPGNDFTWNFKVGSAQHTLEVHSREATGPKFLLDGQPTGGTVDGYGGEAIARISKRAIGAKAGSKITFDAPANVAGSQGGTATYVVPGPTVRLSLLKKTSVVASTLAKLTPDTTAYSGSLKVSGVHAGTYSLVVTACYAGACKSATKSIQIT